MLTQYKEALRGIYTEDSGVELLGEDLESVDYMALEEMLADAYAGISGNGTNIGQMKDKVRAWMQNNHVEQDFFQDNGTEQPTGPPSGQKENTARRGGERYSISPALETQLQDVLDNTFEAKNNEVYIGETSNFLTDVIGARSLRATMPATKAFSAMVTLEQAMLDPRYSKKANYHGLGKEGLLNALERSEDPIAAFVGTEDENGKRETNIVLVTDAIGKDGNIVVVETVDADGWLEGKRINANKVITSYDRHSIPYDIFQAALDGRLLHLDEKRSQQILAGMPGSDYRGAMQGVDFKKNIQNFWEDVKWKKSGKRSFSASGNMKEQTAFEQAYREAQNRKTEKQRSGKERFSNDNSSAESEQKDSYSMLSAKARDYVRTAERDLLEFMGRALSVPRAARREFLAPIVRTITNEYLEKGSVSQQTIDSLFQRAYAEGIVADEEYYNQYKDIKDHLRTTAVTLVWHIFLDRA